jgi:hypothetical protein
MEKTNFNYQIVLFKNKVKKKIINKFQTHKKTVSVFETMIKESNKVIFEKSFENGSPCNYELAIIKLNDNKQIPLYTKDEFGRQSKVTLEDDKYEIIKIDNYKIPDKVLDYSTGEKISLEQLISTYLPKNRMSMVSSINNKIVIQNDDDYKLFTLKTIEDSSRFIDSLYNHFLLEKRNDTIFVKDHSTIQRKYLYKILEEKGFPKSYLFRHSTTHVSKK